MKLSASEARDILHQRRAARQAGDLTALNRLDKRISAAVSAGDWPTVLTRNDSAPAYPRHQQEPKHIPADSLYRKPRRVSWD